MLPTFQGDTLALAFISGQSEAVLVRVDSGASSDFLELKLVFEAHSCSQTWHKTSSTYFLSFSHIPIIFALNLKFALSQKRTTKIVVSLPQQTNTNNFPLGGWSCYDLLQFGDPRYFDTRHKSEVQRWKLPCYKVQFVTFYLFVT